MHIILLKFLCLFPQIYNPETVVKKAKTFHSFTGVYNIQQNIYPIKHDM